MSLKKTEKSKHGGKRERAGRKPTPGLEDLDSDIRKRLKDGFLDCLTLCEKLLSGLKKNPSSLSSWKQQNVLLELTKFYGKKVVADKKEIEMNGPIDLTVRWESPGETS